MHIGLKKNASMITKNTYPPSSSLSTSSIPSCNCSNSLEYILPDSFLYTYMKVKVLVAHTYPCTSQYICIYQVVLVVKNPPSSAGDLRDVGSIPGLGRSPGGGHAIYILHIYIGFSSGSDAKESACNAGDPGSVPGLERSLGEGNGYPLQYYCLENCRDRGTWWATVYGSHRVDALSDLAHMHAYIYTHIYTYHWGCYFLLEILNFLYKNLDCLVQVFL